MKNILDKWTGKYLINHEVKDNLKDWKPKDGEHFEMRLLAKRKETSR